MMTPEDVAGLLARFPRAAISVLPTPLQRLEQVSGSLRANVFCKRDDLTGFAFGGNKTRKLDFLIAEALADGYDTLITMGALQSNFCRMAAGAAVTRGLEVHLVLGGRLPERFTGNLLVDRMFGANIHAIDSMSWDDWAEHADGIARALRAGGRKVYFLPVGGSVPLGALGYVDGFLEIMRDSRRLGVEFSRIYLADGSLGTHAGLLVGAALCGWRGEVVGISVAQPADEARAALEDLCRRTLALLDLQAPLGPLIVDDGFIGECYGAPTAGAREAIELFCRREGIFLDDVYSGKAAAGLIAHLRAGRAASDENLLFLHTGGNIEIFA